jgi:hypothetical protein
MTDSIYQRLLTEGEKHKGTDLGGLLQVAAMHCYMDKWRFNNQ